MYNFVESVKSTRPTSLKVRQLPPAEVRVDVQDQSNTTPSVSYSEEVVSLIAEIQARRRFETLVNEWLAATEWQSSISVITSHPNFTAIVGMGNRALKFMLQEMKSGNVRMHWFPALKDISQQDPVPPERRGFTKDMASAWVRWGEQTGKI